MIINNPNYRSMPEQVDYLTDKQVETDATLDELEQAIDDVGDTVAGHTTQLEDIEDDIETLDGAVEQNTEDIGNLSSEVEAVSGRGGYLIPYNFETATPTEQQLNDYALSQIPNITQPEEIFNGTRVTNLYNNHTWILNNTQDTDPVVFEWVDLGQSLVSVADDNTLGVVKGSNADFKIKVLNDGTMSVNGIANALNGKQDKLTTTSVEDGTIDQSIGFDSLGNIVRGSTGGSLYEHNIYLGINVGTQLEITIISSNPNAMTKNEIAEWLYNRNYKTYKTAYKCVNQNDSKISIGSIYADTTTSIRFRLIELSLSVDFVNQTASLSYPTYAGSYGNGEVTDTVTQIV